jgi:DNA-binding response OmpR family regulator
MKVLLIEDDAEMVEFISIAFSVGWPDAELLVTHQGRQGVEFAGTKSPDVVILDLGLPDISGYDTLKQIRSFSNVPIIIETVRNTESDIVKGLDLGADEYIKKPFGQLELLAKIKAVIRRQCVQDDSGSMVIGTLRLDASKNKLYIKNKPVSVTNTEVLILRCLMAAHGRAVDYDELADAIWGNSIGSEANNIRVYIRRLRKKNRKPLREGRGDCLKTRLRIFYSNTPVANSKLW